MLVTASVPDDSVGDVMGDLSSRRGRPLGTDTVAGMAEVKAEVPMSEMLSYAPGPARADRRPGRVHARVPALRGDPGAPRPEGGREGPRRGRSRGMNSCGGRGRPLLPSPFRVMARTRDIKTNQLRHRLRRLRAHAAAGRARRALPGRWGAPARSATCAPRAPSTRAGSGSPAPMTCAPHHPRHEGRGRSFLERLRTRRERAREMQRGGGRGGGRAAAIPAPRPTRRSPPAIRGTSAPSRPTPS